MRDALALSLPWLTDKFPTHKAFTEASVEQILGPRLSQAGRVEANTLASMVFLNRGASGPARLRPFSKERASMCLEQVICYGEQHIRDAQKSSLHDLLRAEVLELRYSDLHSAVDCLEALVCARGRPTETPLMLE